MIAVMMHKQRRMVGRADLNAQDIERRDDGPLEDTGVRLRALRTRHGLSQRDLARRAGVTNGSVSMIESAQVSPSIASLKKLADAMSMTLAEFFSDDLAGAPDPFFRANDLTQIGGGGVSLQMVPAGVTNAKLQVLREVYPPGSDTGPELLSHAGEESGVIVKGRVNITVGANKAELGPGDAYYFDSRLPHRFANHGDEECEIVSASTPRSF